ncbi:MAG: DUF169 domain-containing protein [Chloroflexota bacterium]
MTLPAAVDEAQAVHVEERRAVAAILRKLSVARPAVGISFCTKGPPAGYEPVDLPACALVAEAEGGRRVYIDRTRHDCIVGQFHLGLGPGPALVTEGHYLTLAQGFYTAEGARLSKVHSSSLPQGSITAFAAAPLVDVPVDVVVDLMTAICTPQQAMVLGEAGAVRSGEFAQGDLGAATCSAIFAAPALHGNIVVSLGDSAGRAFNKVDASELFVVIPRLRFRQLIDMMDNFWIRPREMRRLIHPSHALKGSSGEAR